jgi:hypothetical protein
MICGTYRCCSRRGVWCSEISEWESEEVGDIGRSVCRRAAVLVRGGVNFEKYCIVAGAGRRSLLSYVDVVGIGLFLMC